MRFCAFLDDFKKYFRLFLETFFFGILSFDLASKEENFVVAPMCFHTFFPGLRVSCVFILILSLGVWWCGRGAF